MKKHKLLFSIIAFTVLFILSVLFTFKTPTDTFDVTGTTIPLKKGDVIVQKYQFDNYKVNNIILREATYGDALDYVNFDVTLYDKDNNVVETSNYEFTDVPDVQFFSFPISNRDLIGEYTIKIVINDISKSGRFTIYKNDNTNTKSGNYFMINKDMHGGTIAMNICGYKRSFFYSFVILAILLVLLLILFVKIDHNSNNIINKVLDKKWSLLLYIVASFLTVCSLYYTYVVKNNMMIQSTMTITNSKILYCQILLFLLLICSTFLLYYIVHSLKNNDIRIEKIYLLLIILIGMMYTFYINPLNVGDSEFHYISAYQPIVNSYSRGDTEILPKVVADKKYELPTNINDYQNLINKGNSYDNVEFFEKRGRYSFVDYIPTTIGIYIGKALNLSPYIGMWIAKFISFIVFVILGYFIIRFAPFGKMLFMVYLLSPTFIQQTISMSIDSVIFMSSLLFISYLLKIKFDKKDITYKDILLLGVLLVLFSIQKTNYIIIGALVFLLIDKLKKNNMKKWIYCFIISALVIGIIIAYYLGLFVPSTASAITYNSFLTNSSYVYSSTNRSVFVYLNTFIQLYPSYFMQCFTNNIGWTASLIKTPVISIIIYFIALFSSMLYKEKNKHSFGTLDNVLLLSIYVISILFIEYALYVGWTYIGLTTITGINGRYFVPFNILLLLFIHNKIKNKRIDNQFLIPLLLIACHIMIMLSVLTAIS